MTWWSRVDFDGVGCRVKGRQSRGPSCQIHAEFLELPFDSSCWKPEELIRGSLNQHASTLLTSTGDLTYSGTVGKSLMSLKGDLGGIG